MIRAELLVTEIGDLATLRGGSIPRTGSQMSLLGRISRAALAVDQGKFVFVGRAVDARREGRLRPRGRTISAESQSVLPGFVDPHTHVLFAGDRSQETPLKVDGVSYGEIAERGGGLFSTVRSTRLATDRELLAATESRLRRMARAGTTTVEVKSGYALTHFGELRLLRLMVRLARRTGLKLIPTFLGAHAVPPEFVGRGTAYIDQIIKRTLPVVVHEGLARFCDVFCEPGFFTVPQSERLLRAAGSMGLLTKIHADEFAMSGGARLAARLHATSADHLLATPEGDFGSLARAGVIAVLLPTTAFASFSGCRSPGRAMVDAGVAVALGSDFSPNSWVESMSTVLAHGVYGARLTPHETLSAATVNAAAALGIADQAGQIAFGRAADFAIFDVPTVDHLGYRLDAIPTAVFRQGIRISSR